MKKRETIHPFPVRPLDEWDELIRNQNVDEMGLLDLVFIEEILNQKKRNKSAYKKVSSR
jgi:hypothetical protein